MEGLQDKFSSLTLAVNEVIGRLTELRQQHLTAFAELLNTFGEMLIRVRADNEYYGTGFSPFLQFAIDERTHTVLIGNLLDPEYSHGQGKRFLLSWLHLLGIRSPEEGIWNVHRETANVDVLLKREAPHSVVIIENKSNYAVDQPGQLYRYWYEQIYLPNKAAPQLDYRLAATYERKDVEDRYKIVYLSPSRFKAPAPHSLKIPDWMAGDASLPRELPLQWHHGIYNELIVDWLADCITKVPLTNLTLPEYLNMYIAYWNKKA